MDTGPSVLVVDDERVLAALVAELLAEEGYAVRCAFDGAQALAEVERDPPDVLVTDLMMPRLDGLDLARRLRADGRRVPVVVMSAVHVDVILPGVRFLAKPFDLDDLLAAVAWAVDELDAGPPGP